MGEELADLFISFWFPLYYELKILFLIWLLSPATRGATFLYRQVIHPNLARREEEIDEFVKKCKDESYSLGVKYVSHLSKYYYLILAIVCITMLSFLFQKYFVPK